MHMGSGVSRLAGHQSAKMICALVAVVFLLFSPSLSCAQSSTATLNGTAVDQVGATVAGVEITVMNTGTGLLRQATTNESGYFVIPLLPPGIYLIKASREGFNVVEIKDIVLHVGDQVSLPIALKVGPVSEKVTVEGGEPPIRTDGSVGTVINRTQIANMPLNGRSLHALIQLTPGVVLTTAGGGSGATGVSQFSVNGQRTTSNYFMVDGVGANTGMSIGTTINIGSSGSGTGPGTTALGGTNSMVSLDALQEFRIETSSYAAEYGRTPGGQISLVTRGGTNEFHGSGSYYFRNEALDANEWFANSLGLPKAKERQSFFSGTFGGPLYLPAFGEGRPAIWKGKDRAFFFLSYEGLRLQQPKTGNISVPTSLLRSQASASLQPFLNALPLANGRALTPGFAEFDATYSDPASFNIWSLRLDTNVTKKLATFFRFSRAPSESQARTQSLSTITHSRDDQDSITGAGTWVAGSRMTVDVRVNWTKNFPHQFLGLDTFAGAVVPDVSQVFLSGWNPSNQLFNFFGVNLPGFTWGQGTTNVQRQVNIVGTVAWSLGAHQLKFGVDNRRLLPIIRGGQAPSEQVFFLSATDLQNGRASYSIRSVDPAEREPIITSLSLFAQDTWHATRRLTLTYGLRFERVPPATDATGQLPRTVLGIENNAIISPRLAPVGNPLWKSRFGEFGPRLGIAYQVIGSKGWEAVVRGGAGIFYDLGLGSIADAFSQAYPYFVSQSFGTVSFPPPAATRIPPPLDGTLVNNTSFELLDPNLRLPYTVQWNGSWEQTIGSKQSLTVSYVGASGHRLLLNQNPTGVHLADNPAVSVNLQIQRSAARSSYRALQVQFQRRLDLRLQVLSSYTLARSWDNVSDDVVSVPTLGQEWGPSDFDVQHVFSTALSYELPKLPGRRVVKAVTKDWGLDLLFRYQFAFPVNPQVSQTTDAKGVVLNLRPDLVAGQPLYINDPTLPGGRRINSLAFARPPTDQNGKPLRQGNFLRNGVRGFAASQVDLALRREFKLGERVRLQFRAELFNVFNHPNFGSIDTSISSSTFGRARKTLSNSLGGLNPLYQMGGPRSGEFAVKISF